MLTLNGDITWIEDFRSSDCGFNHRGMGVSFNKEIKRKGDYIAKMLCSWVRDRPKSYKEFYKTQGLRGNLKGPFMKLVFKSQVCSETVRIMTRLSIH